jgi:predicted transcriptional regulator
MYALRCNHALGGNMNKTAETMIEYVSRKLKEPGVKVSQVAKVADVKLRTVYHIIEGKDALFSNVNKLNDYFRKAAD